jgi:hypothetical protein
VGALRLTEEAARDVLLVRAIEAQDHAGAVFTREDRQHATAAAVQSSFLRDPPSDREIRSLLTTRADLALGRLTTRYPKLQRARHLARWPHWLNWALPLGALVLGLVTNAIDGAQLNILAFPLLGMIAWNLTVYAWLLVASLRRTVGRRSSRSPRTLFHWLLAPSSAQLAGHPTLERAVSRFGQEWADIAAPLTRTRASRTLHLSAAAFAAGLLAGMFARARYTAEYTASWSGTWVGAEREIAALLNVVLGPASALTDIALPSIERLRELRGAGENAGDWLILWMVTAALYVIVPRLVLALASFLLSERLKRRLPVEHDFYVRRVIRDAIGRAHRMRVVPYSFELTHQAASTLKQLITDVLGERTSIELEAPVAYGNEDQWLGTHGSALSHADQVVLLFNLSSTPEAENHGALVSGVRQQLANAAELLVLLDDSGFVHRHRGQASASRRLDDRLQAWRAVLAAANIEPVRVRLDQAPDTDAVRSLEKALLRGTASS